VWRSRPGSRPISALASSTTSNRTRVTVGFALCCWIAVLKDLVVKAMSADTALAVFMLR